jgi:putative conjugative transposon DNA recombination protein
MKKTLQEQANLQLKKWNYLFKCDESKKDLLHKSFAVFNRNGTRVANQFIVEVDITNKRFLVFSSKNPKGYKKFYLSFDYLNNLGKIDGDDTILKIVTPQEKVRNQLLKEFDFS